MANRAKVPRQLYRNAATTYREAAERDRTQAAEWEAKDPPPPAWSAAAAIAPNARARAAQWDELADRLERLADG